MAVILLNLMKMTTQKGHHTCECTELSLKRKKNTAIFNLVSITYPGSLVKLLRFDNYSFN